MNVLIVDDEKLIVDDLTLDVRTLYPDASIDGTTDAFKALEYVEHTVYDIALLDIDMPDMDGLTLAKKIIDVCPVVNIIFVTAYSEFALEAHELYCSAFLMKPVGIRKLKKAFENLRKPFIDLPLDFSSDHYSGGDVIGSRIRRCREQRGISRQEMADFMKVTRQTIYRWESGERIPDTLTIIKLTRLLGVGIEELLSGSQT